MVSKDRIKKPPEIFLNAQIDCAILYTMVTTIKHFRQRHVLAASVQHGNTRTQKNSFHLGATTIYPIETQA